MPEVVFKKGEWTYSWNEGTPVLAVARVTALMSLWPESLWTGDPQYGFRGVLHDGLYPHLRDGVQCRHAVIDAFMDARDGYVEWCHECGAMRRGRPGVPSTRRAEGTWQNPNRVPGPLAAGPGGSGLTRGASVAEKGVEEQSQPRGADTAQEWRCPVCTRRYCDGHAGKPPR